MSESLQTQSSQTRLARVPCEPHELRKCPLRVFLNEHEDAQLNANAAAVGLNRHDYVRMLIMDHVPEVIYRGRNADPHLLESLNRIGNNLNQAVRDMHAESKRKHDWEQIRQLLEDVLIQIALGDETIEESNVH